MPRTSAWRRGAILLLASASLATAACSTVLGLEAPPPDDAGTTPGSDATTADAPGPDGGAEASADSGTPDTSSTVDSGPLPTCAALDAGDGSASYSAFGQGPFGDAGDMVWESFASTDVPGFAASALFSGGAFDGQYVYFAGGGRGVVRFDTHGAGFAAASSWAHAGFPSAVGFSSAVFDGRYVTFVPTLLGGVTTAVAARYDTTGAFTPTSGPAWQYFDVSTLAPDSGPIATGYLGGVFDGRFVYLVPHSDAVGPFGRVARFDTKEPGDGGTADSGAAADAGPVSDAGPATGFADPSRWTSVDLAGFNPLATGFAGGVFAAGALYLVPQFNDAWDASIGTGTIARYAVDAAFDAASSWTTFDLQSINGLANNFHGGAFDGRYLYLAPRGNTQGIALRYDTTAPLDAGAAWTTFDTTLAATSGDGGVGTFYGAAYDGRFVYYVPNSSNGAPILRYDTYSPFDAPCAWSSFDSTQLGATDAGPNQFVGAVFDGTYLYLPPNGNIHGAPFLRFAARNPGPKPAGPSFGSFL